MTAAFATGTRILTGRGEVAVEALRDDDVIETISGAYRPLVFLGRRRVDCARHPSKRDVWPVRVREAAFAEALPARDLLLSPDHAVYIDDVLIPIRDLIDGVTIVQEAADEVRYWHVELAVQDVIFAEGLPCETEPARYGRSAFDNGGTVTQLHPDFRPFTRRGDGEGLARATSAAVANVRRYLLERTRGQDVASPPDAALGGASPG